MKKWILITGQSGSGKGTHTALLEQYCTQNQIPYLSFATGNIIRAEEKSGKYFSQKMAEINAQTLPQSTLLMVAFVINHLHQSAVADQLLIQEGGPRSREEISLYHQLMQDGLVPQLHVVVLECDDEECTARLVERTKKDQRDDLLSSHGVPDYNKIRTKLAWWHPRRKELMEYLEENNDIVSSFIDTTGTIEDGHREILKEVFVES